MINPKTMNTNLSLRRRLGLEIARKITNTLVEQHPLKQLFWECTLRCNLHCRHCGSDCKKISGYADMPKEDFLRVLDNIALHTDPHHVFVVITGGEPLMREDLEECGKAIHDKGFPWGMVTNGLAMTPERFTALLKPECILLQSVWTGLPMSITGCADIRKALTRLFELFV